jgi:dienelactone hydrolase
MRGYLALPAKAGKTPGVLVIHENRGLSPYIEDVARRFATEGYVAFAPMPSRRSAATPADEDKAREGFRQAGNAQDDGRLRRRVRDSSSRGPSATASSGRDRSSAGAGEW